MQKLIIDFRCRPPFSGFIAPNEPYFNYQKRIWFGKRFGFEVSDSVKEKSIDLLLQEMDDAGIDKAVIPARKLCHVKNEELVALLGKHSDRFWGMAGVDPMDGQGALEEIEKFVLNGPCVGISIEPGYCAPSLKADDPQLFDIYQLCQENDLPVFLSFGGLVGPLMEFNNPEIVDRAAKQFPDLKLVLGHGGYPYVTQACYTCFRNPNVYLVPDFYATNVPNGLSYFEAMNWIPDQILFGSGYPMQPVKAMLEHYRKHVDEAGFRRLTYENAAKILKIEE